MIRQSVRQFEHKVEDAREAARDEVWAGYRFVAIADTKEKHGLKIFDLGAGHASASETFCGRIIGLMKSEARLNENVGAGYIDRNWPPAFKDTGAWPLTSLRQSFLDGSLTRLIDPDTILQRQIVEFVARGDFGLASGVKKDGSFERLWFAEQINTEEVAFEADVFLLIRSKAQDLKTTSEDTSGPPQETEPGPEPKIEPETETEPKPDPGLIQKDQKTTLRLAGTVPPEVWNRLGTKLLPKLRSGDDLSVGIELSVSVDSQFAQSLGTELKQILNDLNLGDRVRVEITES